MSIFTDIRRRIERFIKQCVGLDIWSFVEIKCPKKKFGKSSAGYVIAFPDRINANTIVYSVGIGCDISFDVDLINKKNATVYAFDPTPKTKKWLEEQKLPEKFKFFDIGVANFDGIANFYEPENPKSSSYSLLAKTKNGKSNTVSRPVKRLKTIMEMLGHKKIDILKIDVEGAEYLIIEDFLNSKVDVQQFLVEFHHRKKNIKINKTRKAVQLLKQNGFKIFYISPKGEEYSFIKIKNGNQ